MLIKATGKMGKIDKEALRPLDLHVPRWDSDELFHGSYSFLTVGSYDGSRATWDQFLAPVIDPDNKA